MAGRPPFWYDDPDAWDTLIVSGDAGPIRAPGIVDDIDVSIKTKIDKHHGPGIDGGTLVLQGEDVPEVKITLMFWTKEHQDQLTKFLSVIRPTDGKSKLKPRDFSHPILSEHGLKSLVYESIAGPGLPDSKGMRKVTISFARFKLPPKTSATTTPKGSAAIGSIYSTTPHQNLYGPPPPPGGVKYSGAVVKFGSVPKPLPSPSQKGSKP